MVRRTLIFFFFSSRRRHTRLQGDWSSDVCSSDLGTPNLYGTPYTFGTWIRWFAEPNGFFPRIPGGQEAGGLVSRDEHQRDRRGQPPSRLRAAGENLKETLRDHYHVIWQDQIIQFGGDGYLSLSLQPFNLDPSLGCPICEPACQRNSFEDSEPFFVRIPARIFHFP